MTRRSKARPAPKPVASGTCVVAGCQTLALVRLAPGVFACTDHAREAKDERIKRDQLRRLGRTFP